MKRIIIGDGKVSKIIRRPGDVILSHWDVEIESFDSVFLALGKKAKIEKGDVVINTAAKINLEWCEENKVDSFRVNTFGALTVAEITKHFGAKLVHISSGCVFDGNHVQFKETDEPRPAAWYARTKVWADEAIANTGSDHLILRPRQLISTVPYPTNMITKFLTLRTLSCIDEPNSVTCIEDFGRMIDHLLKIDATGIYNCANEGVISPFELAQSVRDLDRMMQVTPIKYEDYLKTIKVKRVNTILDLSKLRATGFVNRHIKDAVRWCIQNYDQPRSKMC